MASSRCVGATLFVVRAVAGHSARVAHSLTDQASGLVHWGYIACVGCSVAPPTATAQT